MLAWPFCFCKPQQPPCKNHVDTNVDAARLEACATQITQYVAADQGVRSTLRKEFEISDAL
jgi:hypothetical protein